MLEGILTVLDGRLLWTPTGRPKERGAREFLVDVDGPVKEASLPFGRSGLIASDVDGHEVWFMLRNDDAAAMLRGLGGPTPEIPKRRDLSG